MFAALDTVWVGFLAGFTLGLVCLWISRWRANRRLQRLLQRIQRHSASPHMSYESQIASAIASQDASLSQLSEQVIHFQEMLYQAPVGYLYIDEENRLLSCNRQAQTFLDIQALDYTPPRLLLAVARSYELDQLIEETRQQQQPCCREWVFYSISPDPSNLSERPAYPLRGYGVPLQRGHVAVFLENRQEAVTLIQQRDRWTSDVTHELKTPLTSIRLVAETLRNRVNANLVSWVDRLLSEVMRLSQLVDDVLDLNRLDQATPTLNEPELADIVSLIHQAWENVLPLANQKAVEMQYQGAALKKLQLHSELVYRLLINLLDNAIKFSPDGGVIQVRVTEAQFPKTLAAETPTADPRVVPPPRMDTPPINALRIDVIDSGPGFVEKDLPFIFDRFYRSDLARSRAKTGTGSNSTGLGLSIVRKIVTVHKGQIEAQNHPDTSGAWLKVWLPLLPPAAEGHLIAKTHA